MSDERAIVSRTLSSVETIRSHRLRNHESGVERLCAVLCQAVGMDEGATSALCFAAGLHDVGKLAVSEAILDKPGRLDAAEWEVVRWHVTFGHDILRKAHDTLSDFAAGIALRHHERWDGSGYPDRLKGDEIPREAQIVSLCDVYDAMRETRPYKPPAPHDEVIDVILNGDQSGRLKPSMFDPTLLTLVAANADKLRTAFEGAGR